MYSLMSYLLFGFITGLSLILAIGPQNIFVIEQGLKKQYIFLVCFICFISDMLLIFLGILIFIFFSYYFNYKIELILNILLILFLLNFILRKWQENKNELNFIQNNRSFSALSVTYKTLGFTFLNPHVYSDTVFFLGNFSKNFYLSQKIYFAFGASLSSLIFFFSLGYLSKFFSKYLRSTKSWKIINRLIILFMLYIVYVVIKEVIIILI